MLRRTMLCVVIVLLAGLLFQANARAADEAKGTVTMACPQGGKLEIKSDCGAELSFAVHEKARDQVKALKAGDKVEVSFVKCPKTGNPTVMSVTKH